MNKKAKTESAWGTKGQKGIGTTGEKRLSIFFLDTYLMLRHSREQHTHIRAYGRDEALPRGMTRQTFVPANWGPSLHQAGNPYPTLLNFEDFA